MSRTAISDAEETDANCVGVRPINRASGASGRPDANIQEPLQFKRAALNHVLQSGAGEALHHNEEMSFVLTDFVDGTNI